MNPIRMPSEYGIDEAIHMDELQEGIVQLSDDIGPFSARDVIRDIRYSMRLGNDSIKLFINSPGGGVGDAIAIYDFIREQIRKYRNPAYTGATIEGVVRGHAASAASMIVLQACEPRVATANSRLHLHEPSNWAFGPVTVSAIRDNAEELSRLEDQILGIVAARAQKELSQVKTELSRRETWMSAEEAKAWGLIDHVGD